MSAASTPAPRSKPSPSDSRTSSARASAPRHSLFVPMLIFLLGSGTLATYQVLAMGDRLDGLTQTIDKLDPRVKRALHEKAVFYELTRELLRLAPTDPNADQIVTHYKLRELQAAQPELLSASAPSDLSAASQPVTNAAPMPPTTANAATVPAATTK